MFCKCGGVEQRHTTVDFEPIPTMTRTRTVAPTTSHAAVATATIQGANSSMVTLVLETTG